MTAKKNDQEKPDVSLIPLAALEAEARAFMHGEKKYGRYNYTGGFDSHRLIAAAMRHLLAYQNGEDNDTESGYTHLGHARASIGMLIHTIALGTNRDTRLMQQRGSSTICIDEKTGRVESLVNRSIKS
jgi:hypothetical protein